MLQHDLLGEIHYCNVMIGAVLPRKEPIFRLQLQFFSLCYVDLLAAGGANSGRFGAC